MSSLIVSPHDPNGHRSASQRREMALQNQVNLLTALVAHLKTVFVIALEERNGEPLIVTMERRNEVMSLGAQYATADLQDGTIVYGIPAPEPEKETAEPKKEDAPT